MRSLDRQRTLVSKYIAGPEADVAAALEGAPEGIGVAQRVVPGGVTARRGGSRTVSSRGGRGEELGLQDEEEAGVCPMSPSPVTRRPWGEAGSEYDGVGLEEGAAVGDDEEVLDSSSKIFAKLEAAQKTMLRSLRKDIREADR